MYILYLAFTEIGGVIHTLMLGSPPEIDTDSVINSVIDVDSVTEVHPAHFWQMGEHEAALDTHVVIDSNRWADLEELKLAIKSRIESEFGIHHSTLEFERSDHRHRGAEKYGHG